MGALFKVGLKEEMRALMDEFYDPNEIEKLLAQVIARAREESQWAWKHTLHHTEKKGREEGIAIGIEQVAKNLINNGVSMDIIISSTVLSEAEILKLKSN